MLRKFGPLLLTLISLTAGSAVLSPLDLLRDEQHNAMHYIVMPDLDAHGKTTLGACTANAIGPHVILTAEHCNTEERLIFFDKSRDEVSQGLATAYFISEKYSDGKDHMLIVTPDKTFTTWIKYPKEFIEPRIGEGDYFWGNPHEIRDIYIEGMYSGKSRPEAIDADDHFGGLVSLWIGPTATGDSGAAIFSTEDGRLLGVLTYEVFDGKFAGAYALAFTQDQLDAAAGLHGSTCRYTDDHFLCKP